eukprot:COSAG02_NODE_547_length_20492_cov_265.508802_20_plen_69_part_00
MPALDPLGSTRAAFVCERVCVCVCVISEDDETNTRAVTVVHDPAVQDPASPGTDEMNPEPETEPESTE